MREIFKKTKGKDFYRDALEYMEYDPSDFENRKSEKIIEDYIENEEIAFKIEKKCS